MVESREKTERRLEPEEYEIYHDSNGVMHFLLSGDARDVRTEPTCSLLWPLGQAAIQRSNKR
jgi:hypothetical protein